MPAKLTVVGEGADSVLSLKLGGDGAEFNEQLARAKAIAGRRFNGKTKTWDYPNTAAALVKIVHTIEPDLSAELSKRLQDAQQEASEAILTHLPDDAAVAVPWRERLAGPQRAGIDFIADHPHALLADDMGSGKTVQSISAVYEWLIRNGRDFHGGRFLVIAPNSVTRHWKRELQKWVGIEPDRILIIDGKTAAAREKEIEEAKECGVEWFIVNWEKLQKRIGLVGADKRHPAILDKMKWDAVIADEAHRAKNRKAQQSRALRLLTAPVQIAATGTPVMNNPGELWPLLRWLDPPSYTSYWNFFHAYTEFYEGYKGKPVVIGVKNADGLRFELADKMVRRTKRQIHPTMHEPFDPIVYECDMTKDQAKVYEEVQTQFWVELAQEVVDHRADEPCLQDDLKMALEGGDLEALKLMIPNAAAKTLRLRQVATSPAVLGGVDTSGKLDAMEEVVVPSGRPWVLFTWFKPSAELIVTRLRKAGLAVESFTGDTPPEVRSERADAFQAGKFDVIVCTLAVGGVGIDLFRAGDCGFIEEDWTPTINDQAFARIDRMGQTQRPQRHIWRARGTVDTGSIAPTNRTKKLITDTIMGG